jgi:argininosuccinate synthase
MTVNKKKTIVLAYSGGLDTSFCVPYLRETHDAEVISVTVDTGGFSASELEEIEARARELGVIEHRTIDACRDVFDRYAAYLIKGNVLRGGVYPLSVSAERVVQAEVVANVAREVGADAIAHGSTGAGNDQVRFDIAFQVLVPDVEVMTPIRDLKLSRKEEFDYLKERGIEIDPRVQDYSVNSGLWGATIGGGETHDAWAEIPDEVYAQAAGQDAQDDREYVEIGFEKGVPVALDGTSTDGVEIVNELGRRCARLGIGRGIHVGDTVLGIKGRIAFEAGAALVLIEAHRELEKITTTQWQRFWKDHLADFYGKMLHEGQVFDPVMRDLEALMDSSQDRVSGTVRIRLEKERLQVVGTQSPHSMMDAASGVYGEMPRLWTGEDVKGFTNILGVPAQLHRKAGGETSSD